MPPWFMQLTDRCVVDFNNVSSLVLEGKDITVLWQQGPLIKSTVSYATEDAACTTYKHIVAQLVVRGLK